MDIAELQTNLAARLRRSTTKSDKIAAISQTFVEVIEKDRIFGSLLDKIKHAYAALL